MQIVMSKEIEKSIINYSLADGKGVRIVVFFNGCPHHCLGCHNPETWDIKKGVQVDTTELEQYIRNLYNQGYYNGITLSGGDPFFQEEAVNDFVNKLRENIPDIDIWCYTGYVYEDIKDTNLIKNINVLVDGPFVKDQMYPKKKFRGSGNQRILYLNEGVIVDEE